MDLRNSGHCRIVARQPHRQPDSPVQLPGIKMREAVVAGQSARDCTLTAGSRAINGDHEILREISHGRAL